jgi:outer membrane protein assembly factor BamB
MSHLTKSARMKVILVAAMASIYWTVPNANCQNVLTSRNDEGRTGANLGEQKLSVDNVNPQQFGQLFRYRVQGNIFAQPLVVNNVATNDGIRNVVYIATADDVVYAFDADDNARNGGLIWSRNLAATSLITFVDYDGNNTVISAPTPILKGDPAHTFIQGGPGIPPSLSFCDFPSSSTNLCYTLFEGNLGIISTPVIDLQRQTMYVVARSKVGDKYLQTLHALNIRDGTNRTASPHIIAKGPLEGPEKNWITFAAIENQRVGLALVSNRVIVAWGGGVREAMEVSIEPQNSVPPRTAKGTYHGYVMAFNADTLEQEACFTTGTSTDSGAGIWQSGRAPVVDSDGHAYFFTGNAFHFPPEAVNACDPVHSFPTAAESYGDSLLDLDVEKLQSNGVFEPPKITTPNTVLPTGTTSKNVADYRSQLEQCDVDLGGSGPMRVPIPGAKVLIGGGKEGFLHIFEKTAGEYREVNAVKVYPQPTEDFKYDANDPNRKTCYGQGMHHVMGGPVVWSKVGREPLIYVSVETDNIRAFKLTQSPWNLTPLMQTDRIVYWHPAAIMSLSADKDTPHTGILWASHADLDDHPYETRFTKQPGILRAYDAENLNRELWNSNMCGNQDRIGYFAKFTPPTVANGKVFMATFSGELVVYGLLPRPRLCPTNRVPSTAINP